MDCEHGTYQCLPALPGQRDDGSPAILVPMWCVTCGAISLRLPALDAGDSRRAALLAGPQRVPVGRAAR